MDVELQKRNIYITLGVLIGWSTLVAFVKTWRWFSRTDRIIIDLPTIGKFLFYMLGVIGTILLLITAGVSLWWLIFYKREYETYFRGNENSLEDLLRIFLIISFVFKTLDILHLIQRQTNIDLFFMDWESSRTGHVNDVSIWRTYFVANEFQEIQTIRRINFAFQLFFVLFFLKIINLENISCAQTEINLFPSNVNCTAYNQVFRTGISFLTLLGTALIQYLVYVLFYRRFITNKIVNFIDLCSVSNISVFILDEIHHGYYIHGRSPHGRSDVNIKDILMNFYRETHRMTATRGLPDNSNEQLFIMKINRNFRKEYDLLFRDYHNYLKRQETREDTERYTDLLLQSYQNLNRFLCAFLDHSFVTFPYLIRNRYFLEKILNYEFQTRISSNFEEYSNNLFFIDNEKTFTKIFIYGEENSWLIWNIITFLFIDYLAGNYILAAIITYLLNQITVMIRNSLGRTNLSKKTLIPTEFLI